MDRMGAKNDEAMFSRHEWWRMVSCNWMHAGVVHLVFNMAGLRSLGVPLERHFGFWRIGFLYVFSGLIGTMISVIFLPGSISVGASASVFGLLGAVWADVIQNHCARCRLRGSNIVSLTIATAINFALGLTPMVDNYMHTGGLITGLLVGVASLAESHVVYRRAGSFTERLRHSCAQQALKPLAAAAILALIAAICVAAISADAMAFFRSCDFCERINCVEITLFTDAPWWSCCTAQVPMACQLAANASDVTATCTPVTTAGPSSPFTSSCKVSDVSCAYNPGDPASIQGLCTELCQSC